MKILVIFTGGTIGSMVSNGIISTSQNTKYLLIDNYVKATGDDTIFVPLAPYNILSENSTGLTINSLYHVLQEELKKDYDGIIITHGTDTLQYTASALWYLFNPKIPVILVSSNYVLTDPRANGHDNFRAAVEYIKKNGAPDIFISYRNNDNITRIYKGNSVVCHLPYSDELYSLNDVSDKKLLLSPPANWSSSVLQITPYVGMKYTSNLDGVKAVLLLSYHSGTICTSQPDSKAFFDKLYEQKIPVFLIGKLSGDSYESTSVYDERHILVLPYASPIAAYMKLFIVTENYADYDTIVKYMMDI